MKNWYNLKYKNFFNLFLNDVVNLKLVLTIEKKNKHLNKIL